mmetsp:Transcript_38765/g.37111  ORF Transcript_38765/g.37111 Transcript_38765/m.37111 type:complete len:80 (-) Transcript_38765:474-713(-)
MDHRLETLLLGVHLTYHLQILLFLLLVSLLPLKKSFHLFLIARHELWFEPALFHFLVVAFELLHFDLFLLLPLYLLGLV